MSSLIVPVTMIEQITPHPNADALELAQVLGWQLVVKKGEYAVGDKIVYFPIDTVLPLELSERFGVTKYLSKQRIRCAKLRGDPTRCATSRPFQVKRLQMRLCCIVGFDTKVEDLPGC